MSFEVTSPAELAELIVDDRFTFVPGAFADPVDWYRSEDADGLLHQLAACNFLDGLTPEVVQVRLDAAVADGQVCQWCFSLNGLAAGNTVAYVAAAAHAAEYAAELADIAELDAEDVALVYWKVAAARRVDALFLAGAASALLDTADAHLDAARSLLGDVTDSLVARCAKLLGLDADHQAGLVGSAARTIVHGPLRPVQAPRPPAVVPLSAVLWWWLAPRCAAGPVMLAVPPVVAAVLVRDVAPPWVAVALGPASPRDTDEVLVAATSLASTSPAREALDYARLTFAAA